MNPATKPGSALDHVVYQRAVEGGASGLRSEYPIFESRDGYGSTAERVLEGVPDANRATIEATQPYHLYREGHWQRPKAPGDALERNAVLRLLRRLDNQDKHRLVLRGAALASPRRPTFRGVRVAEGTFPSSIRLEDGAELFRIKAIEPIESVAAVRVGYQPAFTVLVGEADARDAAAAEASIGTLHVAARVVRDLVRSFESAPVDAQLENDEPTVSTGPHMVIPWSNGSDLKVGVFIDLALRRRRPLEVWPEVITAIEEASSIGEIWSRLDAAGSAARFAVEQVRRHPQGGTRDIEVHLIDPDADPTVWVGTLLPSGED